MGNGDSTAQTVPPTTKSARKSTSFPPVDKSRCGAGRTKYQFVLDIPCWVTVQIGSTRMLIRELLQLGQDRSSNSRSHG